MINKELIIKAIPNSDLYTESESKILQELIRISIEGIAVASAKYLIKITGISVTTVYTSLKSLQKNELIIKLSNQANTYKLNEKKLNRIVEIYESKEKP